MWKAWQTWWALVVSKIVKGCGRCWVALETKQRLVELLNAYIDARQESVPRGV